MTNQDFRAEHDLLQEHIDSTVKRQRELEEKFMTANKVPLAGMIAMDPHTGVRIKVVDRALNYKSANQNMGTFTYHIWLNGNPVNKRGEVDHSTRTGIAYELTTN